MSPLKVAIIGAGPAGCLLARILHKAGIVVTVFEAEESPDFRSQGGTLDIHPKTGIAAIKAAGLYEEFTKLARPESGVLSVRDKRASTYFHLPAFMSGNPEIDRQQLRSLLLDSIPSHIIRWNHRLQSVNERHELHFAQGVEKGFDLVVGADGAWSKVRTLLSDEIPLYSGIAGHNTSISDARTQAPLSDKLVDNGNLFAFSDGKSIMGQQMGDGSIHVSIWGRQEESWIQDNRGSPISKEGLLDGYHDWAPELLDLIRNSDGDVRTRSFYMLPLGFTWSHMAGVTLIGDAAHLMTPFAGEGVNIALEDASTLADVIISTSKEGMESLDRGIVAFEQALFKRGRKAQNLTENMMQAMYFTKGAPRSTIESWIICRASYDFPEEFRSLGKLFLVAGVHAFYFVYKRFV